MRARLAATWQRIGPRVLDVVLIAVGLLAAFAEARVRSGEPRVAWALAGTVAAAGAIALWWRRRFPVAVALTGLGVVAVTGLPVVAAASLFTLATLRRDRVLWGMTLLAVAVFAGRWAAETDDSWLRLLVSASLVVGCFVGTGAYIGARRDLVVMLRDRARRAEADRDARVEQERLAERARIAREMHDVLAHKVTLIAMHAGALEVQATPTPDQVHAGARLIRTTAREAMDDLRDVLGVLRDADGGVDLAPPPRRDDIVRVVEASRATGARAELRIDVGELPDPLARAAHRVVQEGLTNVHKHARDAPAIVTVTGDEATGLRVEIVNRRPVAAAALLPGSGAGLLGLAERVALVGGTLEAGPSADGGWRLTAWMPWGAP